MNRFAKDDSAYFAWLAENPAGFVLNVRKTADPDYVVLHRAICPSISSTAVDRGAYTGRGYRKWCASQADALRAAAKLEGRPDGSFSNRCGMCKP